MNEFLEQFNDKAAEESFGDYDAANYRIQAVLPYLLPFLFFLPIVTNKEAAFCRFHANQQLAFFILCIAVTIISRILGIIPVLGGILGGLLGVAEFVMAIILMIGAYNGKAYRIPILGNMINVF